MKLLSSLNLLINMHKENQTEAQTKKQRIKKCGLQLKPNINPKVKWMH